ncbi:DUF2179 domain-containing protein [Mycoplasma phocoenae]|uniref:YitT family protein n=1 Tax=Mycoplasma phocoenae TaxID=754517 RepID=A0A858U3Z0_9MOLU|nr:DUF2179 domain-containing protein [Mycoplasma phocoenae]QJG66731.1 YitT family protein [Mycoplasma phocoenae]
MNKNIETKRVRVDESLLFFNKLHNIETRWGKIFITFLMSIFFAIASIVMIQNTGLYGLGVDALSHSIGRFVGYFSLKAGANPALARTIFVILFWGITVLLNIPLIIFSYFKINKNFAIYTFLFIILSSIFGIGFSYIPNSEKWSLFGDVVNQKAYSESQGLISIALWTQQDASKHMPLIIYGVLWAIIYAIVSAVMFIISSSNGGFDVLVVYYSREKFKNLGFFFLIFHILSLNIGNLIGSYIPTSVLIDIDPDFNPMTPYDSHLFFNPDYISGVIMILVNSLVVDILFPKFKLVRVDVMSQNVEEIREAIYSYSAIRFATSISKIEGGFSGNEQKKLSTNCFYMDAHTFTKIVRQIDPDALIIVYPIKKASGYMYISHKNT